jgi:hypothetical protein
MVDGCGVVVQAVLARFALLRASPAGGKELSFLRLYGTAKAVP